MLSHLRPALVMLVALTFLTGLAYPLAVTFVAQLAFPTQANGSLVERDGKAVHLTKKEFDLLWLLIRSGGRVVSRETILSRLWDYAADVETRTVDVHVRSIRKKLGDDVVETVVGVGYRYPA